jgi:hypothetical protein
MSKTTASAAGGAMPAASPPAKTIALLSLSRLKAGPATLWEASEALATAGDALRSRG